MYFPSLLFKILNEHTLKIKSETNTKNQDFSQIHMSTGAIQLTHPLFLYCVDQVPVVNRKKNLCCLWQKNGKESSVIEICQSTLHFVTRLTIGRSLLTKANLLGICQSLTDQQAVKTFISSQPQSNLYGKPSSGDLSEFNQLASS